MKIDENLGVFQNRSVFVNVLTLASICALLEWERLLRRLVCK